MPDLIPFQFGTHPVRVHVDDHGTPWWIAADVGAALGHTNITMLLKRVDEDEKTLNSIYPNSPEAWFINESGLYNLILGSRKPEAKAFKRWVTHEVIPAIRKTGKYEIAPALDRFPELRAIVELAQSTAEARLLAEEAKAEAAQANANATRALETQLFFTVAEYVYTNQLQRQVPVTAYKACSDHLRAYCMDNAIPFRKIPVGGKQWEDEYGFHINAYAEAFPGWLMRRYAQVDLVVVPKRGKRQ